MSPIRFNRPVIDRSDAPLVVVAAGRQEERDFEKQPHNHGRGQLLCSCKGVVSVGLERGVWVVPPRHGIWIPPHCVHSAHSVGVFQGGSPTSRSRPAPACRRSRASFDETPGRYRRRLRDRAATHDDVGGR